MGIERSGFGRAASSGSGAAKLMIGKRGFVLLGPGNYSGFLPIMCNACDALAWLHL